MYKIESSYDTGIARNIMNTIIGTREFDVLRISLYAKDDENGVSQPKVFVTNNGEKTAWKYEYEKDIKPLVREVEDPKRPGKTVKCTMLLMPCYWMIGFNWNPLLSNAQKKKDMSFLLKQMWFANLEKHAKTTEHLTPSLQEELQNLKEDDLQQMEPEPILHDDDRPTILTTTT